MSKKVNQVELFEEITAAINLANSKSDRDYRRETVFVYPDDQGEIFDTILHGYGEDVEDFEHIEQDGGGEGGGESCYSVFKWKGVFYKVFYSYYSYQGFDYDYMDVRVVTPKEKTITVYE